MKPAVALGLLLGLLSPGPAFSQPALGARAARVDGPRQAPGSSVLEVVYVDANTGTSVGGHAALRLGEHVYHFQAHPDGTLRLHRDGWDEFQLWYGSLENRTLHVSRIVVDAEAGGSVLGRLHEILRAQERHFDLLSALELEGAFLESLEGPGGSPPETPGLGLFADSGGEDPHGLALRRRVEAAHGAGIIPRELARAEAELRAEAAAASRLHGWVPEWGSYPSIPETPAERRRDALARRAALRALAEARSLAPKALLDPEAGDGPGARPLDPHERSALDSFASRLEESMVRLVGSERPDRGYAQLLTAARYQAVRRSLAAGRLLLLDPFPDDAPKIPAAVMARRPRVAAALAEEARRAWAEARHAVFAEGPLDEPRYSALETIGVRHLEIQRGATQAADVRVVRGRLVPSRSGPVAPLSLELPREALERSARVAGDEASAYRLALHTAYGYQLVERNCSTELVRSLNSSFPDAQTAAASLGGMIEPGQGANFIPFLLSRQVEARLDVAERQVLPSYRKRRVAEMRERENDLLVYLRESNTLTSTVYPGALGDDAFLFFTDDVFWVRPVFGVVNVGWGLVQTGAGVVTLPWDRGARALSGLRGVFFSLPELAWFNIRKGHFDWIEEP